MVVGTASSVPALAALLTDNELSHMARFALERMPAAEAGAALREAFAYPSFRWLMAGYFVCGFQVVFLGVQAIGYVAQKESGALLPLVLDVEREVTATVPHCRLGVAYRSLGCHFVAPHADPADRFKHLDFVHLPADGRFPEDRLENRARRRRRDHVVRHPFDFHLRAGETGEIAGDFQAETGHCRFPFRIAKVAVQQSSNRG